MSCVAALQNDTIHLRLNDYDVVPLNSRLGTRVERIATALRRGVAAHRDLQRDGFYNIEVPDGLAYIHVFDAARTVYVIAHSRSC